MSRKSARKASPRTAEGATPTPAGRRVVIKISPMALVAVFFFTLGLMTIVLANPRLFTVTLVVPLIAAVAVFRYRTVADADTVTARTLFSRRTARWADVDGLRFDRRSWALARLTDGTEFRLPAVTFATLPQLTAATGGRVPNPYD